MATVRVRRRQHTIYVSVELNLHETERAKELGINESDWEEAMFDMLASVLEVDPSRLIHPRAEADRNRKYTRDVAQAIYEAIGTGVLTQREEQLVWQRFGFDQHHIEDWDRWCMRPQTEVAEAIGVSRARVSQAEIGVRKKLGLEKETG